MTVRVQVPVNGLSSRGSVPANGRFHLGAMGLFDSLAVSLGKPYAGPYSIHPLFQPLVDVPVLGEFIQFRAKGIRMGPDDRRLKAQLVYLGLPFSYDVHGTVVRRLKIPPDKMNEDQGLPRYVWQLPDLFLEDQGAPSAGPLSLPPGQGTVRGRSIRPAWEDGEVLIEGNFSNRTISLYGFTLHFAEVPPGQRQSILVSGAILGPTLTIQGLESVDVEDLRADIHVATADPQHNPFKMTVIIDPNSYKPLSFTMDRYQGRMVVLGVHSKKSPKEDVDLILREGIDVKGFKLALEPIGPVIKIDEVIAKRLTMTARGVNLATQAGDQTVFRDVTLILSEGRPYFYSKISGAATGEILGQNKNRILFENFNWTGEMMAGPDENDQVAVTIGGNIETRIKELRFLAKSERMKAYALTLIKNATVKGVGRITVWPDEERALLEAQEGQPQPSIEGQEGKIIFHQDPSQVEVWPELKERYGKKRAREILSHMVIPLKKISFSARKMAFQATEVESTGQPALGVVNADVGPIAFTGDAMGGLNIRFLGIYVPMVINEAQKMSDATLKVGRLLDQPDENGRRLVMVRGIDIDAKESAQSLPPEWQLCGFDRQKIRAVLEEFTFSPDDMDVHYRGLKTLQIFLKDLVNRGCFRHEKLEHKP